MRILNCFHELSKLLPANDDRGIAKSKLILIIAIVALVAIFFHFDLAQYLSLEYLKKQEGQFQEFYRENTITTLLAFFGLYVAVTGLSLPGAAILTLAGGALFGVTTGTLVVSFASTIGATCAFTVARFMLRDWVQARFGDKLRDFNSGVEREGAFYLFSLRLVPIFPFFMINLAMGLTPISTIRFYLVSQIGMLPGTLVYVNAGTQLAKLKSLKDIASPAILVSFAALGLFPIVAKKALEFFLARKS